MGVARRTMPHSTNGWLRLCDGFEEQGPGRAGRMGVTVGCPLHGEARAGESGRRNGVPRELVALLRPTRIVSDGATTAYESS